MKAPDDGYRNHEAEFNAERGQATCVECGVRLVSESDFMSICQGAPNYVPRHMHYRTLEVVGGAVVKFPVGVK